MPGGRPLKFKSVKKLQIAIDAYFDECDEGEKREVFDEKTKTVVTINEPIPYTITGLAMALGTFRKVLCEYEDRDEYSNTIKMAKQRCENFAERRIFTGKNPAGPIFALKNYNWNDKQEVTHSGDPDKPLKWEVEIIRPKDTD